MPGDLVHADRHGAVIVPGDIVPSLGRAIAKMQESERLILEPARETGFDFDQFAVAWEAFERSRV
jgi:regulator of RNase E activity RraA